ncbi:MAG: hypothetical protein WA631_14590 [Nitrososphaeraceae archaeon]
MNFKSGHVLSINYSTNAYSSLLIIDYSIFCPLPFLFVTLILLVVRPSGHTISFTNTTYGVTMYVTDIHGGLLMT